MQQQLSQKGIQELFSSGTFTGKEVIVQLLSFEQLPNTSNASKNLLEVILSDGFAKHKAVLVDSASKKINDEFPAATTFKPIIKISSWKSNEQICLIREIEIMNRNYTKQIGGPIDYPEFVKQKFSNPKGSNVIQTETTTPALQVTPQKRPNITMKIVEKPATENQQQTQTIEKPPVQTSQQSSVTQSHQKVQLKSQQQRQSRQIIQFSDSGSKDFMPISILHPMIGDFLIKARVTSKTPKKEFQSKTRNEKSSVFSIDILDEEGSSITCAFFGAACNKFFDHIEVGAIYKFSGGSVKVQQKKFTNTSSDYQIYFEEYSLIQKLDNDEKIKAIQLHIYDIRQVKSMKINDVVDVLGIVKVNIQGKLKILGQHNFSVIIYKKWEHNEKSSDLIYVSLWGDLAERNQLKKDDIVCLKSMMIRDFNGEKQLTSGNQGTILYPNDLQDNEKQVVQLFLSLFFRYKELVLWSQNNQVEFSGKDQGSYLALKYCSEIEEVVLQQIDRREDLNNFKLSSRIRAFLVAFTSNSKFVYPACEKCQRKMSNETGTSWRCESCNQNFPTPNYRFVLQGKFSDMTGSIWVTTHDNVAQTILGKDFRMNGNEFEKLDEGRKNELIKKNYFKEYNLQILTRIENYQGQWKGKHQIQRIVEDDYITDVKELYDLLTKN